MTVILIIITSQSTCNEVFLKRSLSSSMLPCSSSSSSSSWAIRASSLLFSSSSDDLTHRFLFRFSSWLQFNLQALTNKLLFSRKCIYISLKRKVQRNHRSCYCYEQTLGYKLQGDTDFPEALLEISSASSSLSCSACRRALSDAAWS